MSCGYRFAWRFDPAVSWLRRSTPWSKLGEVAHGLIEDVAKGLLHDLKSIEDVNKALSDRWKEREEEEFRKLAGEWQPAIPPEPQRWPGYSITKVKTIRRAARSWSKEGPKPSGLPRARVERWVEDRESGLAGRPDRVEGPTERSRVIDLKTAVRQEEPTSKQRRQLLIYCQLVRASTGHLPAQMAIEDTAGRRWEEKVDPAEVDAVVAEVSAAKETVMLVLHQGDTASLARPAPDVCLHCPYRLICGPYWSALTSDWNHGSVLGKVENVYETGESWTMELAAVSPTKGSFLVSGMPHVFTQQTGRIAIIDAEVTESPNHLRWRWSSRKYQVE